MWFGDSDAPVRCGQIQPQVRKDIADLDHPVGQGHLMDVDSLPHPTAADYAHSKVTGSSRQDGPRSGPQAHFNTVK